jgi:hypothetical protein
MSAVLSAVRHQLLLEGTMTGSDSPSPSPTTYDAATDDRHAVPKPVYSALGKVSGHGVGTWVPAPSYLAHKIPTPGSSDEQAPQRVVAILDTVVRPHVWLLDAAGNEVCKPDAEWGNGGLGSEEPDVDDDKAKFYGSHAGHATFLAGIVRQAAPAAAMLSLPVMDIHGHASDDRIIAALHRLVELDRAGTFGASRHLAVVLMAFGREAMSDDADVTALRAALAELAGLSEPPQVVVAAGNDGQDRLRYPAAFAAESELHVTAVGSLATAPADRSAFSSFGPWVTAWRYGTNTFGAMPLQLAPGALEGTVEFAALQALPPEQRDFYAWWSGTSFAAAQYAGELASGAASVPPLPQPIPKPKREP